MNVNQEAHALLGIYENLYYEKTDSVAVINKYRDKWGMKDMIDSFGYEDTKKTLHYFFKTSGPYSLKNFYNHADDLLLSMRENEKDQALRKALMQQTKEIVENT